VGMRLTRDRPSRSMRVDQQVHVENMLKQFGMTDSKPVDTPEQVGVQLTEEDCPQPDVVESYAERRAHVDRRVLYQSMVGCLLYVALSTRPDICHAVNQLSRFLAAPGESHLQAAKRVMRYLRGTAHLGLVYDCGGQGKGVHIESAHAKGGESECIEAPVLAYTDADWGGCIETRKSTTGVLVFVYGCPISWSSKKQKTVALSSAEAEYMAIGSAVQEMKWVQMMLEEIGCRGPVSLEAEYVPSVLLTDSQSAQAIVKSDGHHQRTKHIDIRHHFVKEYFRSKAADLEWVQSAEQLADIFTKALDRVTFIGLRDRILQ
jgi:hypothetical protein